MAFDESDHDDEEEEENSDDNDDDDDSDYCCECDEDDSTECSCEYCSRNHHARSFLNFLHASMMEMELSEDDHSTSTHGSIPGLTNKYGEEEKGEDDDPDAPKCAICFSTRRSLEDLPCCGGNAEETSSTRFCRSCLVKAVKSQVSREGFISIPLVGECPRCRNLLAIYPHVSESIRCATFEHRVNFVLDKESLRKHLFTMAFADPCYIPKDVFMSFDGASNSDTAVSQLVQWGILRRTKKADLYSMNTEDQAILRDVMSHPHNRPSFNVDNEDKWQKTALLVVAQGYFESAVYAVFSGFKIFRAIRLLNHSMVLFWMAYEYVPPPPFSSHMWLVNLLNMFVACLLVVLAVVVGTGALIGWMMARSVRWTLQTPEKHRRTTRIWSVGLLISLHYFVAWYIIWAIGCLRIGLRIGVNLVGRKYDQISPELLNSLMDVLLTCYLFQLIYDPNDVKG